MKTRDETIATLRDKLGRKPTEDEIKAERDRQWWRQRYADMAISAVTLPDRDEGQ
jgi:hypothetical protein